MHLPCYSTPCALSTPNINLGPSVCFMKLTGIGALGLLSVKEEEEESTD